MSTGYDPLVLLLADEITSFVLVSGVGFTPRAEIAVWLLLATATVCPELGCNADLIYFRS